MELTPKQIVRELDRYIIGQDEAKRAVAVALRNRYRRGQLPPEIRDEIEKKVRVHYHLDPADETAEAAVQAEDTEKEE